MLEKVAYKPQNGKNYFQFIYLMELYTVQKRLLKLNNNTNKM